MGASWQGTSSCSQSGWSCAASSGGGSPWGSSLWGWAGRTSGGIQSHGECGGHGRGGHSPSHRVKGSGAGSGCPISPSCSWLEGGVCLHWTFETGTKEKTSGLFQRRGEKKQETQIRYMPAGEGIALSSVQELLLFPILISINWKCFCGSP